MFSKTLYCSIVSLSSLISVLRSSGSKHTSIDFTTSSNLVCSNIYIMVCALSFCLSSSGLRYMLSDGFLISLDNDNISSILGTPRVTFDLDATPAKWNVFRVICVETSPILWPAIMPTISPGATIARL